MSSISRNVYEKLKDLIILGELNPGEKLCEADLANRLASSRTPIREAFIQLKAEGYIEVIRNKGAYVTKLPVRKIEEIYDVIALIEAYASETATERLARTKIDDLRKIARKMGKYAVQKKYQEYTIANIEFHSMITRLTENTVLIKIYEELRMMVHRYRMMSITIPGHWETYLLDHKKIIDAFSKKDAKLVGHLTMEHVNRVKNILVDFLKNNPGI
jgi:DNA-binding GntR family transcriptional regulator